MPTTEPNADVRITPKDVYANFNDDELRQILEFATDTDVLVDEHPELEQVYETYGADRERMKQDIIDELKRREQSRIS